MKLTDSLEEQETLEILIDQTKPKIPSECSHLNFLLYTPFRYSPYPFDSRFRRANSVEGVFYGSERTETAIAEKAFFRLLFYMESPATPWPANPGEFTAFAAEFGTTRSIDLTLAPLVRFKADWTHPTNYGKCLELAEAARAKGIEVVRYQSVRDPNGNANLALLTCRVFKQPEPIWPQTWRMHFSASGIRAVCEFPKNEISFERAAFATDPRIAGVRWDR